MTPARPPAGITAADFFEIWLPKAYAETGKWAPDDAPLVRVSLSGEGGGDWEIEAGGERIAVGKIAAGTPPAPGTVWIRQTAADFLASFSPDPDLPELLPKSFGPLDLMFLDPQDVEMARQIDGRLAVELTGKRRRRWGFDLATGKAGLSAGRPRATVKLDHATYEGLRDGSLAPLKALLERKIVVDGDRGLAMQALLLLGSRLARA